MSRLIEADAVYKILESCEIEKATIGNPLTDWEYGYTCGIERAESEIECAPTVDAEPVRHGYWKNYKDEHTCSCCGETVTGDWYDQDNDAYWFCPWCGAKMDAERKEE